MTDRPSVVVVGDLASDVVVRLAEDVAPDSDTAAQIQTTSGGSGANVAAWLAASGTDVAFVGRVGNDTRGQALTAELRDLGVTTHVAVDAARSTGTIVVVVAAEGERTMLPDRGANAGLDPSDLPAAVFHSGAHLHLSGYTLLAEGSRAAALEALRLAREARMTISIDPSSVRPLQIAGVDRFLAWTRSVDICLPNRDEACLLAGTDDVQQAATTLAGIYGHAVVTLGADGAVWSDGHDIVRVVARRVEVVDTTGAGDAFTAGYLGALARGENAESCLLHGVDLAASAVQRVGARPARGRPA